MFLEPKICFGPKISVRSKNVLGQNFFLDQTFSGHNFFLNQTFFGRTKIFFDLTFFRTQKGLGTDALCHLWWQNFCTLSYSMRTLHNWIKLLVYILHSRVWCGECSSSVFIIRSFFLFLGHNLLFIFPIVLFSFIK